MGLIVRDLSGGLRQWDTPDTSSVDVIEYQLIN